MRPIQRCVLYEIKTNACFTLFTKAQSGKNTTYKIYQSEPYNKHWNVCKHKNKEIKTNMEDFLRSATTQGQSQDAAFKQADSIWRMLDQMAENDPENYKKFIGKHLSDGKEYFALPEPEMVAVTHCVKPNGKIDKRVFINYFSWMRVPAPSDPQGAIPMTGKRGAILRIKTTTTTITIKKQQQKQQRQKCC